MDKDQPKNNEQQPEIKGHVLTPEETTDWGNKSVIVEPGVNDQEGNEVRPAVVTDDEQQHDDDEQIIDEDEYEEPAPVITAQDPGDFKPQDYSFEVTVYDEEGKNGKSVKIKSIDDFEELLDKDVNFGTSSALLKAQRLATKMESNTERDQAEWKKKHDAFNEQVVSAQVKQEQIDSLAAEINYLVGKGRLPAVDKRYANADWSDPEVAKQPGVKEQVELLNYMRKENDARKKAKLSPLTSVLDAYNALQLETRDKKATDVKKAAGEARKEAGARVAGSTPAPVTNAPRGVAVGRGGSLRDLDPGW